MRGGRGSAAAAAAAWDGYHPLGEREEKLMKIRDLWGRVVGARVERRGKERRRESLDSRPRRCRSPLTNRPEVNVPDRLSAEADSSRPVLGGRKKATFHLFDARRVSYRKLACISL